MLVRHTASLFAVAIFASVLVAFGSSVYLAYSADRSVVALDEPLLEDFDDPYNAVEPDDTGLEVPIPGIPPGSYVLRRPPISALKNMVGNPTVKKDEVAVQVPILMFHHVRPTLASHTAKDRKYSITPEAFEAQMIELKNAGYITITPGELEHALLEGRQVLPEKAVLLTFDDGYKEHYTRVYPILKKYSLRATFFIVTDDRPKRNYVTDAMLKEMDESGLITIAAHTKNHTFLTKLSAASLRNEVKGSKDDLEKVLGHSVDYFAYPFGALSPQVQKEVEDAGYKLGFWIRLGYVHTPSSKFQLRRIRVEEGESIVALMDAFGGLR